MPMPQRKPRPPTQLLTTSLSQNGRGFYGSGATGTTATALATLAAAAAASSAQQSTPTPNPQPPLITDTLTACLDVNGTYICTSYSPRCYIIQKVTATSVTVTPHIPVGQAVQGVPGRIAQQVPGHGGGRLSLSSSSTTVSSSSSSASGLVRGPHGKYHHLHNPNVATSSVAGSLSVASASAHGMCSTSSSKVLTCTTTSSSQSHPHQNQSHLQIQSHSQNQSQNHQQQFGISVHGSHEMSVTMSSSSSLADVGIASSAYSHILGRSSHTNSPHTSSSSTLPPGSGCASVSGAGACSLSSGGTGTGTGTGTGASKSCASRFENGGLPPPVQTGGRVLMNGEVSSSLGPTGEVNMPSMGLAPPCSLNAGTHLSDTRSLNGLRDGGIMPREQIAYNNEMTELEHADPSPRSVYNDQGQGHNMNPMAGTPSTGPSNSSDPLSMAEVRKLLLNQLEYYFSPENLANDKFLVSQMDSDHYVYISTLANFNMVKKLTSDLDLITSVLRESKSIQVHGDGKRARPISQRTVVILRGIPEKTPVEEIKALFENENCPKCNSCEFAFNDSWYISFESDEDAQQAHRYLREDVREFKGLPIMARIKSRPTTLLSQGVNVHTMKNGFHQAPAVMSTFISSPYVPVSQGTGPAGTVAASPMYPTGQQVSVPPVFTIPQGYPSFGAQIPWASYYEVQSPQMNQMYSINGIAPQNQPSPSYPKSTQMPQPRQRNSNSRMGGGVVGGPRRTPNSSSDSISNNSGNGSGALGVGSSSTPHHQYNNQRKNNNGAPTPLLGMAPTALPLVSPHASSHNHHNHAHSTSIPVNPTTAAVSISQNGRQHFMNALPQPVPHNVQDAFHHQGPARYNRVDSRARSSLVPRKGPRRDEDVNYENNSAQSIPPSRVIPSTRPLVAPPMSPQIVQQVIDNPQHLIMNFDLGSSAFPPLPGVTNPSHKNGDSPYEGRLSDVVKGVKNMKLSPSGAVVGEKDDVGLTTAVPGEIVVSVADHAGSPTHVISATSPTKDVDGGKKDIVLEPPSSQTSNFESQKNFRDIGVGSADDSHEIRSTQCNPVSVVKGKETADKSTLIETTFLNGDQQQLHPQPQPVHLGPAKGNNGPVHGQGQGSSQVSGGGGSGGVVGHRKSVPPSSGTKSPTVTKRAVPAFQSAVSSSIPAGAVGPEVPYSSKTLSSPVSSPAKSAFSSSQSGLVNRNVNANNPGNPGGGRSGAAAGATNTYMAKTQVDNNQNRASGPPAGPVSAPGNNLNTSDKDAFPMPGFVKNVPMTSKPFSGLTDHSIKENNHRKGSRTDDGDKEKKDVETKKIEENHCSSDERDGPVRLSYAQVAQSGKEKPPLSPAQTAQATSVSPSSQTGSVPSTSTGGGPGQGQQGQGQPVQNATEDKKKPYKEAKEIRTSSKILRGNSNQGPGNRDQDRDRGDRDRNDRDRGDRSDRERGDRVDRSFRRDRQQRFGMKR